MIGQKYLEIIQNSIEMVINDPDGYEVDPIKGKNQDLSQNMNKLRSTCQKFVEIIINSIDKCPLPFRVITHYLVSEVVTRFPNASNVAAAGFIFLRFFCPAILFPDTSGLISTELNDRTRRPLVLISKSIQNLANGLKSKETYLNDMNIFIDTNLGPVQDFLTKLATIPHFTDYERLCSIEEAVSAELPIVHANIVRNLEKIGQTLCSYKQDHVIEPLVELLGTLGELPGVEYKPAAPSSKKKILEGFADIQKKLT